MKYNILLSSIIIIVLVISTFSRVDYDTAVNTISNTSNISIVHQLDMYNHNRYHIADLDGWFNYRVTSYIINNNIESYLNWTYDKSWYCGIDKEHNPCSTQINKSRPLHILSAILYKIINYYYNIQLYDFIQFIPVIFGNLFLIGIFFVTREFIDITKMSTKARDIAGISAMIFTSSHYFMIPHISPGHFTVESLGLLFSIWFMFIFLKIYSIIKNNTKHNINTILYVLLLSVLCVILAFISYETYKASIYFVGVVLLYIIIDILIISLKRYRINKSNQVYLYVFITIIILTTCIISFSIYYLYDTIGENEYSRLIYVIAPWTDTDILNNSITENRDKTIRTLYYHFIFIILSSITVYCILFKKEWFRFSILLLIVLISSAYFTQSYGRLEILLVIALSITSGLTIATLLHRFQENTRITDILPEVMILLSVTSILVLIPFSMYNYTTILYGINDNNIWPDALQYIIDNTKHNDIILSVWDYGHLLQLTERYTINDGLTYNSNIIYGIYNMMYSEYDTAINELDQVNVDYFLIYYVYEIQQEDYNNWNVYNHRFVPSIYYHYDLIIHSMSNSFDLSDAVFDNLTNISTIKNNITKNDIFDSFIYDILPNKITYNNNTYNYKTNSTLDIVYHSPIYISNNTQYYDGILIYKIP